MSGRNKNRVNDNPHLVFSGGRVDLDTGFAFLSDFTVEARVLTTDLAQQGQRVVVEDTGALGGWALSMGDTNNPGTVRFFHRELAKVITDADSGIVANKEYHIAAVLDTGLGLKSIYIDGKLAAQDTGIVNTLTGKKQNAAIGGVLSDTGRHFKGYIDDVRVWNVVRTAAELKANKANGALDGTETGLVGHWVFNTDTGVQLDQTVNGNDGTLVGDVQWGQSPLEVDKSKRVNSSSSQTGLEFDYFGAGWGDKDEGAGAQTRGIGFLGWLSNNFGAGGTILKASNTKRVTEVGTTDRTKRVTAMPEAG